jgi:hypothetical protein
LPGWISRASGSAADLIRHRLTSVQRIRLAANIPQQDVLKTVLTSDMNNIRATIDMIDNESFDGAINAILRARRIYVLGIRSAMSLAQFLTYYLDYVCDNVCSSTAPTGHPRAHAAGGFDGRLLWHQLSALQRAHRGRDEVRKVQRGDVDCAHRYADFAGGPHLGLRALRAQRYGILCGLAGCAAVADQRDHRGNRACAKGRGVSAPDPLEEVWHAEGVYLSETLKEERS